MIAWSRAIVLMGVGFACGPVAPGSGVGGPSRFEHGADRVVITRFTHINGVALTQRFAFITSETGLAVFDRLLQSWVPPTSEPERGPTRRVLGVAAHPFDDGAWIIEDGGIVYFEPTLGWSLRTAIIGTIDGILFDRRDPQAGIFVRALGRWTQIRPSGAALTVAPTELPPPDARLSPTTLEELTQRRPALRTAARLLTRDPTMRSWEPSAADEPPEGGEIWLGTWGYGLFRVDPEFMRAVHEPYGLLGRGGGAVAATLDGVWIAGLDDPRASADGLVFASTDLRDWIWQVPRMTSGLARAEARALVLRSGRAWIATDRGAVRFELDGAPSPRTLTSARGLPSDDVLALLPRFDGVWIGTSRGLVFVRDHWDDPRAVPELVGGTVLAGTAVHGLVAVGDTLWIASDAGLLLLPPGETSTPVRIGSAATDSRLARRVLAISGSDSVVAVATDRDVLLLDVRTGVPLDVPAVFGARLTGAPTALAIDSRTLWIGGWSGVIAIDRETGASRRLSAPGDLPGRVHDIALSELAAWIATDEGVVRLLRFGGGLPR